MIEPLIAVILISFISLLGGFIVLMGIDKLKGLTLILVSLAAGTLLGDAVFHVLPEAYAEGETLVISTAVIAGILVFFVLEELLHWHHHHSSDHSADKLKPLAVNNLVADGLHNLIDGVLIGAGFAVSPEVGIATTIAVALHEIPQEIGDFGVLIFAGIKPKKAILLNLLSAAVAILGLVVFQLFNLDEEAVLPILAFAGGAFLYIALVDLLPEINKGVKTKASTLLQLIMVLAGVVLMYALTFLE